MAIRRGLQPLNWTAHLGLAVVSFLALSLPADADEHQVPAAPPDRQAVADLLEAGKFAEADAAGRELLATLEAGGLGNSPDAAVAIDLILQAAQGLRIREPEIVRLAERAVQILESASPDDHERLGRAYYRLANSVRVIVSRHQAVPLYEKAIQHQEIALAPDDPVLAHSLHNLALLKAILGDFASADALFERTAGILEARLGPDHADVGFVVSAWGGLRMQLGDYEGARPLLEREVLIRERADGAESMGAAVARMNLANLHRDRGDDRSAKSEYRRSMRIFRKNLGPLDEGMRMIYVSLGAASLRMGDFRRAGRLADRALAAQSGENRSRDSYWGWALVLRADAWRERGRPDLALPAYMEGISVLESAHGPDHPFVAAALEGMALAQGRLGQTEAALDNALRAERLARDHFRRTVGALSEREGLRYERARRSALDSALSLLASWGSPPQAASTARVWDTVIRSSAMVLDEIAMRQRWLVEGADPDHRATWEELADARNELARLVIKGPPGEEAGAWIAQVEEARERKERAEKDVARASPWYERQVRIDSASLGAITDHLPEGAALVRYLRYSRHPVMNGGGVEPSYAAFVLRPPPEEPVFLHLGGAVGIDKRVSRWRDAVASAHEGRTRPGGWREGRLARAGERLRQAVWDPLAPMIEGARVVFVVTDGALSLVNVSALPASGGGFLVERDPTLHYLTSERDIVPSDPPTEPGRGLLVVGGPDYDAPPTAPAPETSRAGARSGTVAPRSPRGSRADLSFAPLPGALREAEEIVSLWSASEDSSVISLTGPEALESAVKRLAVNRRIIHMATHGFFLDAALPGGGEPHGRRGERSPESSGIPVLALRQPLLRSGLALAGANRGDGGGEEDGILTAEEVAGLDLSAAEWVVLSACETGGGSLSGSEGILGLRRALRIAGAKTIIMSLWQVEDEAASFWMKRLYEARLAGLSTHESVRRASLETLDDLRRSGRSARPSSWASFVAVGDWR